MEISKEERELYDRQIRLWGIEGQNNLRNARILLIGFEAVAVEVVKNLCLAGVGSLTLQSTHTINEADLGYNFFVRSESIGQNSAEASVIGVQRLNPRVIVTSETNTLEMLSDEYLSNFNVVIVTQNEDKSSLLRIDTICRSNGNAFYYCNMRGWAGILIVDLGEKPHNFMVERDVSSVEVSEIGRVSTTQEIVHVKPPARGSSKEKLTVTESYSSLEQVLNASANFANSLKVRQRARVSPYLPAFLALLDSPTNPDIEGYSRKLGLNNLSISETFSKEFDNSKGIQISAIASVLGGLLSQEVLNYLTSQEYPIQNVLIYDAEEGKGPVYYLSS